MTNATPYYNADWMKPQRPFSAADRFRFDSSVAALPGNPPITFDQGLNAGLGALSLGAQTFGMANQSLGLPNIPGQNFAYGEKPTYGLGSAYNQVSTSRPRGASVGEVGSGIAQGLSIGSTLGPVGAGVGAVVGGLGTLIGGGFRKNKQQEEKRKAMRQLNAGQNSYNAATNQYIQGQNIREDYLDQLTRRSTNLFKL